MEIQVIMFGNCIIQSVYKGSIWRHQQNLKFDKESSIMERPFFTTNQIKNGFVAFQAGNYRIPKKKYFQLRTLNCFLRFQKLNFQKSLRVFGDDKVTSRQTFSYEVNKVKYALFIVIIISLLRELMGVRFVKSIELCHFSNYKRFYESVDGFVRNSLIVGENICTFFGFLQSLLHWGL